MTTQRTPSDQELLALIVHAAREAAGFIRSSANDRTRLAVREKRPADFVSEVDEGAEARIRAVLLEAIPHAAVVGEELSPEGTLDGDLVFVVDPLDGTTNFLHGFAAYSVSIAAILHGRLTAGVVLDATRDDLYSAIAGGGAWLNDAPLSVSLVDQPGQSLIGTGFPFRNLENLEDYLHQFSRVTRARAGIRRAGSAALDLAWVAAGRFDAFWEQQLAPWDMAAGILLVREAGGQVSNLAGADIAPSHTSIVASNGHLHSWLLGALGNEVRSSSR